MSSASVSSVSVHEVMHPGIVSCDAATGAADVARIMFDRRVHCVAVVSAAEDDVGAPRIWGIVSDLDILAALARPGSAITAADLASEPVVTVRPTLTLREAADAMVRYRVHHVVVTDPERHTPVGVLSTLDVARVLGGGPRRAPRSAGAAATTRRAAGSRAADIRSMLRDRASRNP